MSQKKKKDLETAQEHCSTVSDDACLLMTFLKSLSTTFQSLSTRPQNKMTSQKATQSFTNSAQGSHLKTSTDMIHLSQEK